MTLQQFERLLLLYSSSVEVHPGHPPLPFRTFSVHHLDVQALFDAFARSDESAQTNPQTATARRDQLQTELGVVMRANNALREECDRLMREKNEWVGRSAGAFTSRVAVDVYTPEMHPSEVKVVSLKLEPTCVCIADRVMTSGNAGDPVVRGYIESLLDLIKNDLRDQIYEELRKGSTPQAMEPEETP